MAFLTSAALYLFEANLREFEVKFYDNLPTLINEV